MISARELLIEITGDPALVGHIGDTDSLVRAGVNSGDIVRMTLAVEERLGRPLDADDADRLVTLHDIDGLLGGAPTPGR